MLVIDGAFGGKAASALASLDDASGETAASPPGTVEPDEQAQTAAANKIDDDFIGTFVPLRSLDAKSDRYGHCLYVAPSDEHTGDRLDWFQALPKLRHRLAVLRELAVG